MIASRSKESIMKELEEISRMKDFKGYILLDMVADYNTIIAQYEIESLAKFEEMMTSFKKGQKKNKSKKPPKYTELYQTGKREIFKIV